MGLFNRKKATGPAAFDYAINHPEKLVKRSHKVIPWIDDPFKGANSEKLVFQQRHEADTIELFFDLFFVANLATFTAYHSILSVQTLAAYVGFFAIIWSTWFQITLHDVRFSRDSVYERICKVIQMITFVALALVGSKFQPTSKKEVSNTNFRVLCYTLAMSRLLLGIQYLVVLLFAFRSKAKKLFLPLVLCLSSFFAAAAIFFLMTLAFKDKTGQSNRAVYAVWWVVMLIEAVVIIAVSCTWRMLSFKATHLVERMGLLTLIVIGEGAIGVTKTVSKIMGKNGPDLQGSFLICCIVLVLVFFWMLYFDNQPKQHYGTIRQQIWSVLHFPLHLAIVGVVEGAQQMVLAHYVLDTANVFSEKVASICIVKGLNGTKLRDALVDAVAYYAFDDKPETLAQSFVIMDTIYTLGNTTGVCSQDSLAKQMKTNDGYIDADLVTLEFTGALFAGNGAKLPPDSDPSLSAAHAFLIAFQYYWVSFFLVLVCSMIFLQLVRKNRRADLFDWLGLGTRTIAALVSLILFGYTFKSHNGKKGTVSHTVGNLLSGPYIVPIVVILLFIILSVDRIARIFCNWRLKRKGLYEEPEEHAHEHDHGHGHGQGNHDSKKSGVNIAVNEVPGPGYSPVPSFELGYVPPPIQASQFPPVVAQQGHGYTPQGHPTQYQS